MTRPTLFYSPGCPYCKKVIRFINDNEERIYINYENVTNDNSKNKLRKMTERGQIPVLLYEKDGDLTLLYESDDIIKYLDKTFK